MLAIYVLQKLTSIFIKFPAQKSIAEIISLVIKSMMHYHKPLYTCECKYIFKLTEQIVRLKCCAIRNTLDMFGM